MHVLPTIKGIKRPVVTFGSPTDPIGPCGHDVRIKMFYQIAQRTQVQTFLSLLVGVIVLTEGTPECSLSLLLSSLLIISD